MIFSGIIKRTVDIPQKESVHLNIKIHKIKKKEASGLVTHQKKIRTVKILPDFEESLGWRTY